MFRDDVALHYRVRGYDVRERVKVRGRSGTVHACDMIAQGPLGNLLVTFGDEGGFEGPELAPVRTAARDIGAGAVIAAPSVGPPVVEAARQNGIMVLDEAAMRADDASSAGPDRPEADDHPWPAQDPDERRATRADPARPPSGAPLWKHPRAPGGRHDRAEGQAPFSWLKPAGDSAPDGVGPTRAKADGAATTGEGPATWERPAAERTGGAHGIEQIVAEPSAILERALAPEPEADAGSSGAAFAPRRVSERIVRVPVARQDAGVDGSARDKATTFDWHWVWGPALYGAVTALLLLLAWVLFT